MKNKNLEKKFFSIMLFNLLDKEKVSLKDIKYFIEFIKSNGILSFNYKNLKKDNFLKMELSVDFIKFIYFISKMGVMHFINSILNAALKMLQKKRVILIKSSLPIKLDEDYILSNNLKITITDNIFCGLLWIDGFILYDLSIDKQILKY